MKNSAVERILDQFNDLSIEEQTILLDFLTMTRAEMADYLQVNNHDEINELVGERGENTGFFGIYMTKTAEAIKGKKKPALRKLPTHLKGVLAEIRNLSVADQIFLLREVAMTRKEVLEALSITDGALGTFLFEGSIRSVKRGLFLKKEIERRKSERQIKNFTKEMVVASLQEAAKELGPAFTYNQYMKWAEGNAEHPGVVTVCNLFSGSFSDAMQAANLQATFKRTLTRSMTKEEKEQLCIDALIQAASDNKVTVMELLQPMYIEWRKEHTEYPSYPTIVNVLGGWKLGKEKANARGDRE